MNTKINYVYRDASNYKVQNSIIVKGIFTKEQKKAIYETLNEGLYFIPQQIGLPEERFSEINEDDHCWFELYEYEEEAFELTDEVPTIDMSSDEVYDRFIGTEGKWDEVRYAIVA